MNPLSPELLPAHQISQRCAGMPNICHVVHGFRRSCFQNIQKLHSQRRQCSPDSAGFQLEIDAKRVTD